ncbi:MAG: hypothetical protein V1875_05590 [Candidatus Altiarchaeota archaeon]
MKTSTKTIYQILTATALLLILSGTIAAQETNCTDSDGGIDIYTYGWTTVNGQKYYDYCSGSTIYEAACVLDGKSSFFQYQECQYGCQDGACLREQPTTTTTLSKICTDSDGGKNYYLKGTTCQGTSCESDLCLTQTRLFEMDCGPGGDIKTGYYHDCPNGCTDGACIKTPITSTTSSTSTSTTLPNSCFDETAGDEGGNYNIRGVTSGFWMGVKFRLEDVCTSDGITLKETYCKGTQVQADYYKCPNGCKDGACASAEPKCTDSDGGIDIYTYGWTTVNGQKSYDYCSGSTIYEAACSLDGKSSYFQYSDCKYGCQDGACMKTPTTSTTSSTSTSTTLPNSCFDETAGDEGGNYNIQGITSGYWNGVKFRLEDVCTSDGITLKETYCKGTQVQADYYKCPNGCKDGACAEEPKCTDSDGGIDIYTYGWTTVNGRRSYDYCSGSTIYEAACSLDGKSSYFQYQECKYGCQDGACKKEPVTCRQGPFYKGDDVVLGGKSYHFSDFMEESDHSMTAVFTSNGEMLRVRLAPRTGGRIILTACGKEYQLEPDPLPQDTDVYSGTYLKDVLYLNGGDLFVNPTVAENTTNCTDSDGGKNYYVKGTVKWGVSSYDDVCQEANLVEFFCQNNQPQKESYSCPLGCQDGACVNGSGGRVSLSNGVYYWPSKISLSPPMTITLQSQALEYELSASTPGCSFEDGRDAVCDGVVQTYWKCEFAGMPQGMVKLVYRHSVTLANWQGLYLPVGSYKVMNKDGNLVLINVVTSKCTDSDGGIDIYTYGWTTVGDRRSYDYCSGNTIYEAACTLDGKGSFFQYQECKYGCQDGACKQEPALCQQGPFYRGDKVVLNGKSYVFDEYMEETDHSMTVVFTSSGEMMRTRLTPKTGDRIFFTACGKEYQYAEDPLPQDTDVFSGAYLKDMIYIAGGDLFINPTVAEPTRNCTGGDKACKPYITVTSPNGGESIAAGGYWTIKWSGNMLSTDYSKVKIELLKNGGLYRSLTGCSTVEHNSMIEGITTCLFPSDIPAGSNYKIAVIDDGAGVSDASDDHFSIVAPTNCTDSDGGKDYYVKGTTKWGAKSDDDVCQDNTLIEFYCENNQPQHEMYTCPSGCQDGACKKEPVTCRQGPFYKGDDVVLGGKSYHFSDFMEESDHSMTAVFTSNSEMLRVRLAPRTGGRIILTACGKEYQLEPDPLPQDTDVFSGAYLKDMLYIAGGDLFINPTVAENTTNCTDSDGGKNYPVKGTTRWGAGSYDDVCKGDNLIEFYCENGQLQNELYTCPNGCKEGACIGAVGDKVVLSLKKGWNLMAFPGKGSLNLGTCSKPYGFVFLDGKYITLSEAEKKLGTGLVDYLSTHSFWAYSLTECDLEFVVDSYATFEDVSLDKGWNLAPVTKDLVGNSMKSVGGECDFTQASGQGNIFFWDAQTQNWRKAHIDYIFGSTDRYDGVLVYTKKACELGLGVPSPPGFPPEE